MKKRKIILSIGIGIVFLTVCCVGGKFMRVPKQPEKPSSNVETDDIKDSPFLIDNDHISAIQLREKNFKDTLLHYVEINNLTPEHIEIEITESVLIEDFESTISILEELRNRGFKVSLDDFGTGYSSLSYLRDIPIDTLKIDKSFVDTILLDDSTSIITDAVITMVKKLGLETIAEGVETEEQFEYLKNMHCDNIQGFLLGKPMPSEKLIELIMEENKRKLERTHYV